MASPGPDKAGVVSDGASTDASRPTGRRGSSTRAASLQSIASIFGASGSAQAAARRVSTTASTDPRRSPAAIITRAYRPCVPVVASDDADELARRKGYRSFFDLLRPYGQRVESKVTLRDSQGTQHAIDDFGVNFVELGSHGDMLRYAGSTGDGGRPGLEAPSGTYVPGGDLIALERQIEHEMDIAGENVDMFNAAAAHGGAGGGSAGDGAAEGQSPGSSDYYYAFLDEMLAGLPVSAHESFSHPAASCIAISSHNADPIETLVALYRAGHEQLPSYVDGGFLRYYVLVHDEDAHDLDASLSLYEKMRRSFGEHCHMLRLSSKKATPGDDDSVVLHPRHTHKSASERLQERWRGASGRKLSGMVTSMMASSTPSSSAANSPDLANSTHTATIERDRYLPVVDHSALITMVRDMVLQSLIPYMERRVHLWNDQVAAPRRGLAGRFMKASRGFWGSSRSSSSGGSSDAAEYDPATSSYPPKAAEAQLRKLADFAFMLRDWRLAHSVYDMLRKDYSNDKAWRYHAGAQEMYAITLMLLPQPLTQRQRAEIVEPTLDSALYSYLSRSSAPFHALRALLVAAELLRYHPDGAKDDAAKWVMRAMEAKICGEMTRALLVEHVARIFTTDDPSIEVSDTGKGAFRAPGQRRRKAAFWRVLAAEQWAAMGKLRLARDALYRAAPVYARAGEFDDMLDRPDYDVAAASRFTDEETGELTVVRPAPFHPARRKAVVHDRTVNARWRAIDATLRLLAGETRVSDQFLLTPAAATAGGSAANPPRFERRPTDRHDAATPAPKDLPAQPTKDTAVGDKALAAVQVASEKAIDTREVEMTDVEYQKSLSPVDPLSPGVKTV